MPVSTAPPPWFHSSDWHDAIRMRAMFEPFRPRDIIPEAYDGKMNFWREAVRKFCIETRAPAVTLSALEEGLVGPRGEKATCLLEVLKEMSASDNAASLLRSAGDCSAERDSHVLVPADRFPGANWDVVGEGWAAWAFRKAVAVSTAPAGVVAGYLKSFASGLTALKGSDGSVVIEQSTLFFHPETVSIIATELYEEHERCMLDGKAEQTVSLDCVHQLYPSVFRNLRGEDARIVVDRVLGHLQRTGRVRLGMAHDGKYVKFVETSATKGFGRGDNGPVNVNDVNVARLRKLEHDTRRRVEVLENEASYC